MNITGKSTTQFTGWNPTPEHIEAMKAIIKQENIVTMIERDEPVKTVRKIIRGARK